MELGFVAFLGLGFHGVSILTAVAEMTMQHEQSQ